jgi:hypothetical protein
MYVGQTRRNLSTRWAQHKNVAKNPKRKSVLYHAWRKHGDPILLSLGECSVDNLSELEIFYIKNFNTLKPNGYNTTPGGDVAPTLDPEVAAKVGRKGRKHTPEQVLKNSLSHMGKPAWNKGIPRPRYIIEAMVKANTGSKMNPERRSTMAAAQQKRKAARISRGMPHHNCGRVGGLKQKAAVRASNTRRYVRAPISVVTRLNSVRFRPVRYPNQNLF